MRVEVYTKPGCTCCDDVIRRLLLAAYDYELEVEVRDISTDLALFKRFGHQTPVVFFDRRLRFRMQMNDVLLRRLLRRIPRRT